MMSSSYSAESIGANFVGAKAYGDSYAFVLSKFVYVVDRERIEALGHQIASGNMNFYIEWVVELGPSRACAESMLAAMPEIRIFGLELLRESAIYTGDLLILAAIDMLPKHEWEKLGVPWCGVDLSPEPSIGDYGVYE